MFPATPAAPSPAKCPVPPRSPDPSDLMKSMFLKRKTKFNLYGSQKYFYLMEKSLETCHFSISFPWLEVNSLSTLTTMAGAEVTAVVVAATTALAKFKLRSTYNNG